MAPTASVTRLQGNVYVFPTSSGRTVTAVPPTRGSWPAGKAVNCANVMLLVPSDHLVMSSQDSATACLALEAAPAASARSSSGEIPTWSAEPVTVMPGALRHHSVTSPRAIVCALRVLKVHAVTSALEDTRVSSRTALPATSASLYGTQSSLS